MQSGSYIQTGRIVHLDVPTLVVELRSEYSRLLTLKSDMLGVLNTLMTSYLIAIYESCTASTCYLILTRPLERRAMSNRTECAREIDVKGDKGVNSC
jgi:hypothetical protein